MWAPLRPMDFNGMVRHYYLREGPAVAEIRANFVGKKNRTTQSHAIGLRIRDELTAIAQRYGAVLSVVESAARPTGDRDAGCRDSVVAPTTTTLT